MILNYVHKSPHRCCLEVYLRRFLPLLRGEILDIGSKNRRYDHLLRVRPLAIDINENKEVGVEYGDVNKLKFGDSVFDAVMCIEVLEYLDDPEKAIKEIHRVLKKNGSLILSIPFMYKAHEDKIRLTEAHLRNKLLSLFPIVDVYKVGNFYTIILDIARERIKKFRITLLRSLFYVPYLFFVLLIPLFIKLKDESYASGYFVVARK